MKTEWIIQIVRKREKINFGNVAKKINESQNGSHGTKGETTVSQDSKILRQR